MFLFLFSADFGPTPSLKSQLKASLFARLKARGPYSKTYSTAYPAETTSFVTTDFVLILIYRFTDFLDWKNFPHSQVDRLSIWYMDSQCVTVRHTVSLLRVTNARVESFRDLQTLKWYRAVIWIMKGYETSSLFAKTIPSWIYVSAFIWAYKFWFASKNRHPCVFLIT